jgi:hypothetical protein
VTALDAILFTALSAALVYLGAITVAAVVLALRAGGRRDDEPDRHERAVSRFTIPVSVISPVAHASEIEAVLLALTRLSYPELELIVVVSGAAGAEFERLAADWELDAREFFYRQTIATGDVRRIYRSNRDDRVLIVDKAQGGRADALNCGANIARFRYLAVIDPGISFEDDALLRLMAAPLRDPGAVLAATAHVERLGWFDRLSSARALMDSRLFWRHRSRALGASGLVFAWRRDVVLDAKGFSAVFDPESELLRRAVMAASSQGAPARIHRGVEIFGTATPQPFGRGLGDGVRRIGARLSELRLLSPVGIAAFGVKAVSWRLASAILTPLAILVVVAGSSVAAYTGAMSLGAWAAALVMLSLGRASVTTAALLMRGVSAGAPDQRDTLRLVAAAPFEPLWKLRG